MRFFRLAVASVLAASALATPGAAAAWEMSGTKQITLRTKAGETIPIGTVTFASRADETSDGQAEGTPGGTRFAVDLDLKPFRDFFLSMREFKCLEGPELQCYVPYPYATPKTADAKNLAWLEHSLIFFYKAPADYGAKLANGLYYAMTIGEDGIVGTPQSIDLNAIAAPPDDLSIPPFGEPERSEVTPGSRWIESLRIR